MRARTLAAAALALVMALPGCRIATGFGRAAGSFFTPERKVKKLTTPVDKEARLAVLWIGHATALVQIDDKLILTDPVFTSSVGQLSRRLVEPGFDPENLPALDAVLISHVHFDHLSLGSLDTIEPKVRMLLMPHGGATYLTDFGFPVLELGRWQPWEKDGLRITAVPVDHVGWRYGLDDAWMKESFTGYVIEYHGLKVYFAGDSAYHQELFVETGQRFPGIDVALLPIGPAEPHDFMRRFHMDPPESVSAFIDLGAKKMLPIHYDTFVNGTDDPGEPLRQLTAAKNKWSLGQREVVPVAIGERKVFVKKGDGPAPESAKSSPARTPSPSPSPSPKSNVPDDDKLD